MKIYGTPNIDIELHSPDGGTPFLKYYRFDVAMVHFDTLRYIGLKHAGSCCPEDFRHTFETGTNKWIYFSVKDLTKVMKNFKEFARNHL